MKSVLIVLFACCLFDLHFQDDVLMKIDRQIAEINAKKYKEIMTVTLKEDLKRLDKSDSLVKSTIFLLKKSNYGKDILEFKLGPSTKYVTYYHLDEGLIAIDEDLVSPEERERRRFYFANGKLYAVIDSNGKDIINTIDLEELHYRIRRLYHSDWIIK